MNLDIQAKIIAEIIKERNRQDKKFGAMPLRLDPFTWLLVATEELGEITEELEVKGDAHLKSLFEMISLVGWTARHYLNYEGLTSFEPTCGLIKSENYLTEFIQLAAVCVAALEDFELSRSSQPVEAQERHLTLNLTDKEAIALERALAFLCENSPSETEPELLNGYAADADLVSAWGKIKSELERKQNDFEGDAIA